MTIRNVDANVQVHASRVSARKGTHSQVRALALSGYGTAHRDNQSGPEVMDRG